MTDHVARTAGHPTPWRIQTIGVTTHVIDALNDVVSVVEENDPLWPCIVHAVNTLPAVEAERDKANAERDALREAMEGIICHGESNGMKDWPVFKRAKAILSTTTPSPAPIPADIYFSVEHDNFYSFDGGKGMGEGFYREWKPRWKEFPTTPSPAARQNELLVKMLKEIVGPPNDDPRTGTVSASQLQKAWELLATFGSKTVQS